MRVLGCDPGLTGAIALWDDELQAIYDWDAPTFTVQVGKSPSRRVYNDQEYARLIRDEAAPDKIVIEQVNGIKGQSASASFNFGAGFGLLRGVGAALGVPVVFIPPAVWRARLRVPKGKDGSRLLASRLFPARAYRFSRVQDDGRAEACLIAIAGAKM